ncbi:MAG: VWA domain-containing protein, partial [Planctomycetes bacterium]|nr:VWA domain-containing protein [Planctomycetota bacterium]
GLDEEDSFALVPFNDGVVGSGLLLERGAPSEKKRALQALARVKPSASTAIRSSLATTMKRLANARGEEDAAAPTFVTLLSDGQEGAEYSEDLAAMAHELGVNLNIFVVGEAEPEWLARLQGDDKEIAFNAKSEARVSVMMVGELSKIADEIRRARKIEESGLFHQETIGARLPAQAASSMQVGPWVECATKPDVGLKVLSELTFESKTFPLAARWKYANGEVIGVAAPLLSVDASFNSDEGFQKHFVSILDEILRRSATGAFSARYLADSDRIELTCLDPDLAARPLTLRGDIAMVYGEGAEIAAANASSLKQISFERQSAAGTWLSPKLKTRRVGRLRVEARDREGALTTLVAVQATMAREILPPFDAWEQVQEQASQIGAQVLTISSNGEGFEPELGSAGIPFAYFTLPLVVLLCAIVLWTHYRERRAATSPVR